MCDCRHRGAGYYQVYMFACVCAGAVNRVMNHACFGALVHTIARAERTRECLLTPHVVTSRSWRDTGRAASSDALEPPGTLLFLVHDPGSPAWIRHRARCARESPRGTFGARCWHPHRRVPSRWIASSSAPCPGSSRKCVIRRRSGLPRLQRLLPRSSDVCGSPSEREEHPRLSI